MFYAQFEELESFTKFGTQLDKETMTRIKRGQAIRLVLEQRQYQTMSAAEQVAIFMATNAGLLDGLDSEANKAAQEKIIQILAAQFADVAAQVEARQKIAPEKAAEMLSAWRIALTDEGLDADVA